MQLREALTELNADLRDKEISLEQSQKIIMKLTNEYQKIINEYKTLEKYNNELENKNQNNQKIFDNFTKNNQVFEKTIKQNEQLKTELEKSKKEIKYYKENYTTKLSEFNKKEKEIKDRETLIVELKNSGNKFLSMIKERENLIQSATLKINELNAQIEQKDEQLKLMVNFSKEINKENKSNVQELTKQAVKTIKIFYNTLNNNNNNNSNGGNINQLEIKSFPEEEKNYIDELESSLVNKKCSLHLQDAINAILFIPQNQKYVSKEFLIENNFRTNLLKIELFSSLIREFHIISFLKALFSKIKPNESNEPNENELSLEQLVNNVISFKTCFEDTAKENIKLKNENKLLLQRVKEIELYVSKMKNDLKNKIVKTNEKLQIVDKTYQIHINTLNDELVKQKKKYQNDCDKLNNECKKLRLENDKVNNINLNLNTAFKERDDLILHLQEENSNLTKEITNLKTKLNLRMAYQTDIPNLKTAMMSKEINLDNNFNTISENDNNNNNLNNKSTILNDDNHHNFDLSRRSNSRLSYDYTNKKTRKNQSPFKMQTIDNFTYEIAPEHHFCSNIISNDLNSQILITNENNIPEIPKSLTANGNIVCNMCTNFNNLIGDLNNQIPYSKFNQIVKSNCAIPKELYSLSTKINDVISKLQSTTKNFGSIAKEKKIKVSQILEVLAQVEKLLSFLSSAIIKSSTNISDFSPDLKKIFTFVTDIAYDGNEVSDVFNDKNLVITPQINSNNTTIPIINNTINVEIKQFFNINPKVFSSSELIKFYSIYENRNINDIIQIFGENCDEIKSIISKMKFDFETDTSEFEEGDALYCTSSRSRSNNNLNEHSAYKIVNEKIVMLKKFEFNFSIFMEILKHYLVAFEMLIRSLQSQNSNEKEATGIAMNTLYQIFEDTVYYKIDEMEDDIIFNRKVIVKLLLNHKEYLFIAYDV